MDTVPEIWQQRLVILSVIVLTAIIMLLPIASNDFIPNGADMINHVSAIVQAKMALLEGQFPLRVSPYLHSGWRYPVYQFYSTSAYTLAGLMYMLTPANPFVALKLTLLLMNILGGIYLYRSAYVLTDSRYAAALSSIAYLSSPYYLIVMDRMYDFTETVALGLIPVVFFYTLRLFNDPRNLLNLLGMSLAWYLLATTHLITFFYASLFMIFLFTLFTLCHRRYWRSLLVLGGGYLFAAGLSAWYFLPIIHFKQFLWVDLFYGVDQFIDYYTTPFTALLAPIPHLLPISSAPGEVTNILLKIKPNLGSVFVITLLVSAYLLIKRIKINSVADAWLFPLFTTVILIFIFVWSPGDLWAVMPRTFTVAQYCWRLLAQFSWVAALLFAINIAWLFPGTVLNRKYLLLGFCCITFSTCGWLSIPFAEYTYTDFKSLIKNPDFAFSDNMYLMNPGALPRNKFTPTRVSMPVMPVKDSSHYCYQNHTVTQCLLPVSKDTQLIELPVLYYPEMLAVTRNGKKISYQAKSIGSGQENTLLAAVTTVANTSNSIEIRFTGLVLANRISWLCSAVWLIVFSTLATRYCLQLFLTRRELALCTK